jgi:hypothetical protein
LRGCRQVKGGNLGVSFPVPLDLYSHFTLWVNKTFVCEVRNVLWELRSGRNIFCEWILSEKPSCHLLQLTRTVFIRVSEVPWVTSTHLPRCSFRTASPHFCFYLCTKYCWLSEDCDWVGPRPRSRSARHTSNGLEICVNFVKSVVWWGSVTQIGSCASLGNLRTSKRSHQRKSRFGTPCGSWPGNILTSFIPQSYWEATGCSFRMFFTLYETRMFITAYKKARKWTLPGGTRIHCTSLCCVLFSSW